MTDVTIKTKNFKFNVKDVNDSFLIGQTMFQVSTDHDALILWVDRMHDNVWAVWIDDGNEATPFHVDYPLDFKEWRVK